VIEPDPWGRKRNTLHNSCTWMESILGENGWRGTQWSINYVVVLSGIPLQGILRHDQKEVRAVDRISGMYGTLESWRRWG